MLGKYFKNPYFIIVGIGLIVAGLAFVPSWRAEYNGVRGFYCSAAGETYMLMAKNLAAGHGYSSSTQTPYSPSIQWTPGGPFVLALSLKIFGSQLPIIILQFLTLPLIGILIFKIGSLFIQNKKILLLAASISMAEPAMWYFRGCVFAETWLSLFFLLSLWLFLKFLKFRSPKDLYLASIFLALAIYFRVAVLLIPFIFLSFLIYYFFSTKQYGHYSKLILFYVLIFVSIVGPWSLRNYYYFGTFRLGTGDSYGLYFEVAPLVLGIAENKSATQTREELYRGVPFKGDGFDQPGADAFMMKRVLAAFKKYPSALARVFLTGIFNYFTKTEWQTILERWDWVHPEHQPTASLLSPGGGFGERGSGFFREIINRFSCGPSCVIIHGVTFLGRFIWLLITLLAFAGIFVLFKTGYKVQSILFFLLIFCFALLYGFLTPTGTARYRVILIPVFILLAIFGLEYFFKILLVKFRKINLLTNGGKEQ